MFIHKSIGISSLFKYEFTMWRCILMMDLNYLKQQAKDKENSIEQLTKESDNSNDTSNSEDTSSPILLVLYAVISMAIVMLLLR